MHGQNESGGDEAVALQGNDFPGKNQHRAAGRRCACGATDGAGVLNHEWARMGVFFLPRMHTGIGCFPIVKRALSPLAPGRGEGSGVRGEGTLMIPALAALPQLGL